MPVLSCFFNCLLYRVKSLAQTNPPTSQLGDSLAWVRVDHRFCQPMKSYPGPVGPQRHQFCVASHLLSIPNLKARRDFDSRTRFLFAERSRRRRAGGGPGASDSRRPPPAVSADPRSTDPRSVGHWRLSPNFHRSAGVVGRSIRLGSIFLYLVIKE